MIELYRDSRLGLRRPLDDREIAAAMLRHANLVETAREAGRLVGIARTLGDFLYVGSLADLAVRESHQRRGIGRQLAAPDARAYYPKLGFEAHDSAWILRASQPLRGQE